MVKCSFILSIAVCAVVGSSALVEAVDAGSALNDTSVSVTADSRVSTDTEVTPEVTTDSSASAPTAVAGVTTSGSASTTTDVADTSSSAAVEVPDTPTDLSASVAVDAADVPTNTSTSTGAGATTASSSTTNASAGSDDTEPVAGNSTPTTATVAPAANPTNRTPKPTVKATTKPAVTVKTGPTPIDGQVTLVSGYAECGGAGFDYTVYMPEDPSTSDFTRLTCEAGYRCQDVEDNDVFQCKEWPSRDPVAFYGQCGGGSYDGQTFCAPGAVCKYISASFSQCLPTY